MINLFIHLIVVILYTYRCKHAGSLETILQKRSDGEPHMRTLDGHQCFLLYFELAVYLAVMNGH